MVKAIIKLAFILSIGVISFACGQEKKHGKKSEKIQLTEAEWKTKLTPEQYYILRQKGTERPYTGKLLMTEDKGVYTCAGCGNVLFDSDSKFDSHCGWPSFDKELGKGRIKQVVDKSLGMERIEILCAKCDGHLGHIFDDGSTETGKRYCVNSLSMDFIKAK